ncbi:MAG: CaiB/BaiF CoA transferase family protein, partial [Christensenellales bacterium]
MSNSGALNGVLVIDLTRFVSGPTCSMLLGDMGAEVIKVETIGSGEISRSFWPFYKKKSLYFTTYNKNKKGVSINLRTPEGKNILLDLIKIADVLVENYKPGTLEKIGLTDEVLDTINPNLIVTSISGFGQDGPYRNRAAFDQIIQAMSGLMSITGKEKMEPILSGAYIADSLTGIFAAFGTMVALFNRQKNGEGQKIDLSMLDCLYSVLGAIPALCDATGEIPPKTGNRDKVACPVNTFRTKDGYVFIHAGNDSHFEALCKTINREDILRDSRFKNNQSRIQNIKKCESIVHKWTIKRTMDEVEKILC